MTRFSLLVPPLFWIVVVAVGSTGAFISKKVQTGQQGWLSLVIFYGTGLLSSTLWRYFLRNGQGSVARSSAVFDALCSLGYLGMLFLLGERVTPTQLAGVCCVLLGLYLLR